MDANQSTPLVPMVAISAAEHPPHNFSQPDLGTALSNSNSNMSLRTLLLKLILEDISYNGSGLERKVPEALIHGIQ